MAKLKAGRLNGIYGMRTFTSSELLTWANQLENRINDPQNRDDPRWLRRWAEKMRRLAIQKEKAKAHKEKRRSVLRENKVKGHFRALTQGSARSGDSAEAVRLQVLVRRQQSLLAEFPPLVHTTKALRR
jgi:hypothetical protein